MLANMAFGPGIMGIVLSLFVSILTFCWPPAGTQKDSR